MMFRDSSEWVYRYKYQLKENVSVRMMFKYNSKKRALIQEEVYLYADDQEVEGSDFLKKLATYGKDRAWLRKRKVRKSLNNTFLVPGSKMEAPDIP